MAVGKLARSRSFGIDLHFVIGINRCEAMIIFKEYADRTINTAAYRRDVDNWLKETNEIMIGYAPEPLPWYERMTMRIGNWLIAIGVRLGGQHDY
jgi:hypothetical protein